MSPRNASPRSAGVRRPGGTDATRLAGVSQKTVSRAFNDEPTVTEATRDRVLAAAAQLGCRPNGAARALLTGRTYRIGVVSLGTADFGPVRAPALRPVARSHPAGGQKTIHLHRNGAGLVPRGSDPPLSMRRPELTARVVRVLAEGEQ
jgi:hypothetical protein